MAAKGGKRSIYLSRVPQRGCRHPGLWAERGRERAGGSYTGPGAGHPGRRRQASEPPLYGGVNDSSESFSCKPPRAHPALRNFYPDEHRGEAKMTARRRTPEVPPRVRCYIRKAPVLSLHWFSEAAVGREAYRVM